MKVKRIKEMLNSIRELRICTDFKGFEDQKTWNLYFDTWIGEPIKLIEEELNKGKKIK